MVTAVRDEILSPQRGSGVRVDAGVRAGTIEPVDSPAIRVRQLRKFYGDVAAVDGLDLDIQHGEVFALLGPNGAGKTTAVEIMEGHRSRDGGEVAVLGSDPATAGRAWRARVGIVVQEAADAPELTVREMLRIFAAFYPRPRDPREVIERTGLTAKAESRVGLLSGGQRRRLDVALGLVGDPELLFLDEPTTGFDPEARRSFWTLVGQLAADGTTILLTTHYLEEAEALAGRLGIIAGGQVVAVGTPATLSGRDRATARVGWLAADGPRTVDTTTPTDLVTTLAREYDGEVPELTVSRPTLEEAYHSLIHEGPARSAPSAVASAGDHGEPGTSVASGRGGQP